VGIGRVFQKQPHARVAISILGIFALVAGIWSVIHYLGPSPAVVASTRGQFICAETGKPFALTITPGMTLPVRSPHSGKNTGYPAEFCYWTSDGNTRTEPFPVLLNSYLGKRDPTFCPDCGHLVRSRNPLPVPGSPPPTRQQYMRMEE
jgi:hypothetical protein